MMRLIAVRYGMGGCGAHELSLCAAELTVSHHSLARSTRCVEQCIRLCWRSHSVLSVEPEGQHTLSA